jgi:hypothetical protein
VNLSAYSFIPVLHAPRLPRAKLNPYSIADDAIRAIAVSYRRGMCRSSGHCSSQVSQSSSFIAVLEKWRSYPLAPLAVVAPAAMSLAVGVGAAGIDAAGVSATRVEPAPRALDAAVEELLAALAVGAVLDGRGGGLSSSSGEEGGGRLGVLGSGHGEGGHSGEEEGGSELHLEGEVVVGVVEVVEC